jgi:H+/Cl- antiporter ClcA
MLKQSTTLGIIGLAGILIIKILVIGWSKAMGYRGGLIFPSIFVASVLVAIVQLYTKDVGFVVGLIVVMGGAVTANTKLKILF